MSGMGYLVPVWYPCVWYPCGRTLESQRAFTRTEH